MDFLVEIIDASTEATVGFISEETDENPNNNVKVKVMTSVEEVRGEIEDFIDANEGIVGALAFLVSRDGDHFGCAYLDGGEWIYEF